MKTAFDTLNEIKWGKENKNAYSVFVADRIEKKLKEIKFECIKKIGKDFMSVDLPDGIKEIPLHRIREIRMDGKLIWKR